MRSISNFPKTFVNTAAAILLCCRFVCTTLMFLFFLWFRMIPMRMVEGFQHPWRPLLECTAEYCGRPPGIPEAPFTMPDSDQISYILRQLSLIILKQVILSRLTVQQTTVPRPDLCFKKLYFQVIFRCKICLIHTVFYKNARFLNIFYCLKVCFFDKIILNVIFRC